MAQEQGLRRHRLAAGMTQERLAEAAGVTQATISDIETGKTFPHARTVDVLAAALGANINELHRDIIENWVDHQRPEPIHGSW